MNWVVGVLFVIAIGAVLVAWWGIARRVIKVQTRKGLARIDTQPSDEQLLGLVLHKQADERVRQATGEVSTDDLHAAMAEIRAEDDTPDEATA